MAAYPLTVPGLSTPLKLVVHESGDTQVSQQISEHGKWEPYETQLVMERLTANSTFLDMGANIGYYTAIAASIIGTEGSIYAFEPDPANFQLLQRNLAINNLRHVNAVEAAVSDKDSEGVLYLNEGNFGDHQIYDNGEGRASRSIRLINPSNYLQDKVSRIDLVKIDTQGAEYQILNGLMPLLRKQAAMPSLIIEFWPYGLRKAGASAEALLDLLLELEQPIFTIFHDEYEVIETNETQLRDWIKMVDANPEDMGFVNLLVGR